MSVLLDEQTPLRNAPPESPSLVYKSFGEERRPQIDFHCHDDDSYELHYNASNAKQAKAKRVLWLSLALCLFFMLCEIVGGLWANSLAIITDAAHLLTDFASMLISLFSIYIAQRKPSQRMSFGFHRAEVLGAFFSVFLIWVVTFIIVILAIMRIVNGDYEIDATVMAITAGIGVCVNLIMGALLYFGGHGHSHGGSSHSHDAISHTHEHSHVNGSDGNINVRAAFIHVLGDLIQSLGVLIAAMLIFFKPNWMIVDPIVTLMFSVIVLCTTVYILRDALVVLLEGRPSYIDFKSVFASLEDIPGVRKVHDLRIWALTLDKIAVSVHLEVEDPVMSQAVLRDTRKMLREKYGVRECTVQIEHYAEGRNDCGHCDVPAR